VATSQNGWTAATSPSGIPGGTVRITPKGAPDTQLTVRKGDVATVLQYVVDRFQADVEDIDLYTKGTGDDYGFASRPIRGSSTTISNHASATAIDLNATRHPLGVGGNMGYTSKQIAAIHDILHDLRGSVRWGGDYSGRKDGMHFEINTSGAKLKVIAEDIRSGKIKGPGKVEYLPVYVVDPEKVETTLLANAPAGKDDIKREPGFRITTGREIDGKWLVTGAGYRYHMDYLVLESEYKKRPPKGDTPPPITPVPSPVRQIPLDGKLVDVPKSVSVKVINANRPGKDAKADIYLMQEWLNTTGARLELDGYWSPNGATQDALNHWRHVALKYTGDDALGTVGIESLTKLAKIVGSKVEVKE
jgi:hypothetical protein